MRSLIQNSIFLILLVLFSVSITTEGNAQVVQDEIIFLQSSGGSGNCQSPMISIAPPSSVNNFIKVSVTVPNLNSVEVTIYDSDGKKIGSFQVNYGQPLSVNVSNWESGTYFLVFKSSWIDCFQTIVIDND